MNNLPADGDRPTQVVFPGRTSWRTFVQALLAFIPTVNGMLLALQELLAQPPYNVALPTWVYLAVNAGVLLGAFVAKIVSLLMANERVNSWIDQRVPRLAASPLSSRTDGAHE